MKLGFSVIIYTLISSTGLLSGNFIFEEASSFSTIKQRLIRKGEVILDTEGNKDDEAWLVLAQKYRENGIITEEGIRDFSKKQNPGFLREEYWNKHAQNKNNHDFSQDEELIKVLKQTCKESLYKPYSKDLFMKVGQWCKLYLSNDVKSILKFQKDNGNCRFWMNTSPTNSTGFFVWEDMGKYKFSGDIDIVSRLYEGLVHSKSGKEKPKLPVFNDMKQKSKEILKKCGEKSNQIVVLIFKYSKQDQKYYWAFESSWNKQEYTLSK